MSREKTFCFIFVDYQNEFSDPSGIWYKERPCHRFIENILAPYLSNIRKNLKILEIKSDYRLLRPSEKIAYCIPGKGGYDSPVLSQFKQRKIWIKAMNSPEYRRKNGGIPNSETDLPYSDPEGFTHWLKENVGEPRPDHEIILVGLTLDCCITCTAQQLYFRGYPVRILWEGSDVYDPESVQALMRPGVSHKEALFKTVLGMFAKPIHWDELKPQLAALAHEEDEEEMDYVSLKSRL